MKKLLLLFSILCIAGCSNDDNTTIVSDEQPSDIIIKKVVQNNEVNNSKYVQYFNETGRLEKELGLQFNQSEEGRNYQFFEYDTEQRLIAIKLYSGNDVFIRDVQTYGYNAQGQLVTRIDYGDGVHVPYNTTFTYQGNRVDFLEAETNRGGYFIFDTNGKVIETSHDSGGGSYIFHFLTYENGQLKEIRVNNNPVYTYSVDDKPNPLFENFISNSIQYLLVRQFLYDIDFTSESYFFSNNVTNVSYNPASGSNNFKSTTYLYNTDNYPISSSTLRYDGAIIDKTYEYY